MAYPFLCRELRRVNNAMKCRPSGPSPTFGYISHKTLYNRWKRWSDRGIFTRMMAGLAAGHGEEKTVMIDATYLKAHRTATSMGVKKGGLDA